VLENDAKDYAGKEDVFAALLDATLTGSLVDVDYRSPKARAPSAERFFAATLGLYKGGLYVLAVAADDDGRRANWRAVERVLAVRAVESDRRLSSSARLVALDEARARWGPARARAEGKETRVLLHFSAAAAPYVLARPWHPSAEIVPWPDENGAEARMAIRLAGETTMLESWVRSWGAEVQILRPRAMAERVAASLEEAARGHRAGPAQLEDETRGDCDP
jgi:hypothetical protein